MILRLVVTTAHTDIGSARQALEDTLHALCHAIGLGEVVTIDFIVQRGLACHAGTTLAADVDERLLDFGIILEVITHSAGNLGNATFTLIGIKQRDVHGDNV